MFWLAALLLGISALLPWVLLRPNRLAPGLYLRLDELLHAWPALTLLGLAAGLLLLSRWPRVVAGLASLSVLSAAWWLGQGTGAALADQLPFARASAASGFWVALLGAGVAVYGALRLARSGQLGAGQDWLAGVLGWLWLPGVLALFLTGHLSHWSVLVEGQREGERWVQELLEHLRLTGLALLFALLIAAPLAVWIARRGRAAANVLGLANAIQTVPSLALLGLLIAPLSALVRAFPALREAGISGIGTAPALTAMTLYALLPILQNGIVALRGVPAGVMDAATGMGMSRAQRFWRVQLPLALPVWLSGVRQAAVMLVGVAAVAALIGAGGLGTYIFKGLQSAATDLILLGAIPATLLAVLLDALLRGLETLLGRRLGRVG